MQPFNSPLRERDASSVTTTWSLVGRVAAGGSVHAIEVATWPFQVGRRTDVTLTLHWPTVSGLHAEIYLVGQTPHVRDLGSTNGTYVNGKPVRGAEPLKLGDLIQFADAAFRLSQDITGGDSLTVSDADHACSQALSLMQFEKLMSEQAVTPFYQPIITLENLQLVGYEVLGRSRLFGLNTPHDMFLAASQLDLESELSAMFRLAGLQYGTKIPNVPNLFLNTHPAELVTCGLLKSLRHIRDIYPEQPITLEVHEAAATDATMMKKLREELNALRMQLAYDDFGAGQSRLVELMAVSPDVVKFDMTLIRDINSAPPRQQQMLANLVRMVREMGIKALAEGVETEAEHVVCRDLGFELGQGYYYGRPASAGATARQSNPDHVLV
jgi:EAL domain-containing protein (putative c-di-GMP-specific phosphodiesterase class I)